MTQLFCPKCPSLEAALGEKAQRSQNNQLSDPYLLPVERCFIHRVHSHPQNNCCPHAAGVWLAWRRGIYPRGQENKSELFLVALIKILVFGQENFLAQFLILHCTIGLPRWIRGGIKPNKYTQHPPKKPKSSHSKANTQEGLWAQPVHELRLIKQPKTERDDPNVSPASPAQPGGRTVLLLPGHGGWLDQVNITKSSTDKNHSRDPAILQPCCP